MCCIVLVAPSQYLVSSMIYTRHVEKIWEEATGTSITPLFPSSPLYFTLHALKVFLFPNNWLIGVKNFFCFDWGEGKITFFFFTLPLFFVNSAHSSEMSYARPWYMQTASKWKCSSRRYLQCDICRVYNVVNTGPYRSLNS